ncbi:MAG: SseB family protein [Tepidiphilus sp.]
MAREFEPTNTIEIMLQQAVAGSLSLDEFLAVLVKCDLYMPCTNEPDGDMSKFQPLIFDKKGASMAAAFTNMSLMNIYKDLIKGSLAINAGQLLARSAPGFGIVINPGYRLGLEIDEHGIKGIVSDFVASKQNA